MTQVESDREASADPGPERARGVLRHYLPMFEDRSPVLELGCGGGEFLGLLDEQGIKAEGVDADEGMVESARARGLDVVRGDPVAFLNGEPAPGPYQGVFCAHLVEHLTPARSASCSRGSGGCSPPGAGSWP